MSANDLLIRDAVERDAEAIAGLIGELGYPTTADVIKERAAYTTEGGNGRVLVAEIAGRVIGVVTLYHIRTLHRPGGDVCRITAFVIADGMRGAGIGRAMNDAIEKHARDNGCSRIEVTSASPRAGAHAFYERLGYTDWPKRFIKDLA